MSALVLEDYFKPFFKNGVSDRASAFILRGTVLILGVLAVALVYVVQHLGQVLQLSMSVPASCAGSVFGIFAIGMFIPWFGKKATFCGAVIASAVMIYVVVRFQLDMAGGMIRYDTKVTSIEGCSYNFTLDENPILKTPVLEVEKAFHHISYLYYMPLGAIITCVSALFLSLFFGFEDPSNVDPRLLAPMMRKYFHTQVEQHVVDNKDGTEVITVKFESTKNQLDYVCRDVRSNLDN